MSLRIVTVERLKYLNERIRILEGLASVNGYRIELLEHSNSLLKEQSEELKSEETEYFLKRQVLQLEAMVRSRDKRLTRALRMKVWVAFNKAEDEGGDDEK